MKNATLITEHYFQMLSLENNFTSSYYGGPQNKTVANIKHLTLLQSRNAYQVRGVFVQKGEGKKSRSCNHTWMNYDAKLFSYHIIK